MQHFCTVGALNGPDPARVNQSNASPGEQLEEPMNQHRKRVLSAGLEILMAWVNVSSESSNVALIGGGCSATGARPPRQCDRVIPAATHPPGSSLQWSRSGTRTRQLVPFMPRFS